MNKKRLALLARVLDHVPDEKFDLTVWASGFDKPNQKVAINGCGTAACAVGWACSIPSFQRDGLYLRTERVPEYTARPGLAVEYMAYPRFGRYSQIDAVCRFFDLGRYDAFFLFTQEEYVFNSGHFFDLGRYDAFFLFTQEEYVFNSGHNYRIRACDVAARIREFIAEG